MKDYVLQIPKGYIAIDNNTYIPDSNTFIIISKIIKVLEENNYILTGELIKTLSTNSNIVLDKLYVDLSTKLNSVNGYFLRSIFASSEDISREVFSIEDFYRQLSMYIKTYNLNFVPDTLLPVEYRDITVSNYNTEEDIDYTYITSKSITEYLYDVQQVVNTPIVFGNNQIDMIKECYSNCMFDNISITSKVKENIFTIISIIGKENIQKFKLLKTATDVLRYAYFVSGLDFKLLSTGIKFKLKTSDKNVIMKALDSMNYDDCITEMKSKKSQFLSLSKSLYPGSDKFLKYNKAQQLFNTIRNEKRIITFNSTTQELMTNKDIDTLSKHLSEKPGEYIRNLDFMIRNSTDVNNICITLKSMVLNPVLNLSIIKYLENRTQKNNSRIINVKGKPYESSKILEPLNAKNIELINNILESLLINHLSNPSVVLKGLI